MSPGHRLLAGLLLFLAGPSAFAAEERSEGGSLRSPALELVHASTQGDVDVRQWISRNTIQSYETLTLRLEVCAPKGSVPGLEALSVQFTPFTVLDQEQLPPEESPDGRLLHQATWILAPSRPGPAPLFPLQFEVGNTSIMTSPLVIEVQSVLPDGTAEDAFRPLIAPLDSLARTQAPKRYRYPAAGVLLAILLGSVLWNLRKRFQACSPGQQALQDLDRLARDPDSPTCLHEFSVVIRRYLEAELGVPSLAHTPREIQPATEIRELLTLLQRCDESRFSGLISPELSRGALESGKAFVLAHEQAKEGTA